MDTVGQDTAFSQAVQRLSAYADFGDSPAWPSSVRPSPSDVRILLNRYRARREEIKYLKAERNAWQQMYLEMTSRTPTLEDMVGRTVLVPVKPPVMRARRRLHWVLRRVLK